MPFEAALANLRCGILWRREGNLAEAEPHLSTALETFDRLGATPYLHQTRHELRAGGRSPMSTERGGNLTGQESVVASLLAKGLSNREIAAEMVLSPRTVEFHLASIYRKVGVTSRTQLAARMLSSGS